eukprot:5183663-Prymnesium_polylepis.1
MSIEALEKDLAASQRASNNSRLRDRTCTASVRGVAANDVCLKHAAGGPACVRARRPCASLPPHE